MNTARELKRTRLGYIPHDWEIKKLDEIALVTMGQSPKSENYNENKEGLPLIQGNADCEKRYTNPRLWTTQITKTCNVGDIILTVRAPVGYVSKSLHYACIGRGVCSIRSKENQDYLYYYLINYENKWKRISQGSTFESINSDDIKKLDILLPPLKEQNKIASILSTWDKAIELKEKLIEQKKEQKKGLMQKLLTGEVRLPGFDGEWKNEKIKNISNIFRGASPRPISDPKWFDEQSEIGWVRISDVTKSNKVLHQTEQYLSDEGVKKSRLVKKNSIIMSICATVGKPVITGFDVCIHDGFVVFEDVQINKDYFYFALLRKENHWEKYGQTGSQMNLNTDIVGSEKILFPGDPFEQQAIANILITADREINLLESELEFIRNQKKGLMQLLLTGKVRVKV